MLIFYFLHSSYTYYLEFFCEEELFCFRSFLHGHGNYFGAT